MSGDVQLKCLRADDYSALWTGDRIQCASQGKTTNI